MQGGLCSTRRMPNPIWKLHFSIMPRFEMSDVICRNIINMIYGVEDNLEKCENLNHNLDLSDE